MSHQDDKEDKKDLTRIEDLSEFIHEEDSEIDALLETGPPTLPDTDDLPALDDLEDETESSLNFNDDSTDGEEEEESNFLSSEETLDFSNSDDEPSEVEEGENFQSPLYDESEGFGPLAYPSDDEVELGSNDNSSFNFESEEIEENELIDDQDEETDDQENSDALLFETTSFEVEEVHNFDLTENEDTQGENNRSEPTPTREDFSDVRSFSQNISYGKIAVGGNPPYSIILKNVSYSEEVEEILDILKEHGLLKDNEEQMFRTSLEGGSAIIPQISEYSAIYLTHKLRRFKLDILMGLAEEIHPSKSYSSDDYRGLVSKTNLNQNRSESKELYDSVLDDDAIILTTTSDIQGLIIREYLGIVMDHKVLELDEIKREFELEQLNEDEEYINAEKIKTDQYYQELTSNLRPKAQKLGANAIVDVKFNLTPLISQGKNPTLYKLTCTGNAVLATD